jgi:hypothetical protein
VLPSANSWRLRSSADLSPAPDCSSMSKAWHSSGSRLLPRSNARSMLEQVVALVDDGDERTGGQVGAGVVGALDEPLGGQLGGLHRLDLGGELALAGRVDRQRRDLGLVDLGDRGLAVAPVDDAHAGAEVGVGHAHDVVAGDLAQAFVALQHLRPRLTVDERLHHLVDAAVGRLELQLAADVVGEDDRVDVGLGERAGLELGDGAEEQLLDLLERLALAGGRADGEVAALAAVRAVGGGVGDLLRELELEVEEAAGVVVEQPAA